MTLLYGRCIINRIRKNLQKSIDIKGYISYYDYGLQKEAERVAEKKMGRPTDNPKSKPIHVRLDEKCLNILKVYCEQEQTSQAEAIRQGIELLESRIKK